MTEPMAEGQYYSCIIRAWCERHHGGEKVWRYLLIDSRTGERYGFRSPELLAAYLGEMIGGATQPGRMEDGHPC